MKHKAGNTRLAAGLSMTNCATCTADRSATHAACCSASDHARATLRNVASSADNSTGTIAFRMPWLTSAPCNCLANLLSFCKTYTSKRALALLSERGAAELFCVALAAPGTLLACLAATGLLPFVEVPRLRSQALPAPSSCKHRPQAAVLPLCSASCVLLSKTPTRSNLQPASHMNASMKASPSCSCKKARTSTTSAQTTLWDISTTGINS